MSASGKGHPEITQALLAAGADVNAKSERGFTALMLASENGHSEIVQLLESALASKKQAPCSSTSTTKTSQTKHHPSQKGSLTYGGNTNPPLSIQCGNIDTTEPGQSGNATSKTEPNTRLSSTQAGIFHTDAPQNKKVRFRDDGNSASRKAPRKT